MSLSEKNKSLKEFIGVNEKNTTIILIAAIITSFFMGNLLQIFSPILGTIGGYYLIKQSKDANIPKNIKILRIVLFLIWIYLLILFFPSIQTGV